MSANGQYSAGAFDIRATKRGVIILFENPVKNDTHVSRCLQIVTVMQKNNQL